VHAMHSISITTFIANLVTTRILQKYLFRKHRTHTVLSATIRST
jgi:hypothetical protein